MTKTSILVYAWHIYESSGGFEWCLDTEANRAALTAQAWVDRKFNDVTSGTVLQLAVAGYADDHDARLSITEFFEGELQDAFETGQVGHILARFNDEPA